MPINRGRTLDELIEWLEECDGPDGWFDDLYGYDALNIKDHLIELKSLRESK